MSGSVLIRGARLIDPAQGIDGARDVLIEDGLVGAIGEKIPKDSAERVVKAKGLVAAPAFIDLHVHLREPGGEISETIASGTRAAARGGFARVFAMPNTRPVCDSPVMVKQTIDRAREACGVRVHPVGSVTRAMDGSQLTDLGAMQRAGAWSFSDDGLPIQNAEMMRMALECVRDVGGVIFDHCEDLSLTGEGVMHEGTVSLRLGLRGIPRASEAVVVARDAMLAQATGARLHVCHVSNSESVEVIRHFKARGAPITAEVTPHHLTLSDERVGAYDTDAKMKPPLCDESDREALIAAVEDGTIDCIATDHAPHAPATKEDTFDKAPFGVIGMETAFAVLHTELVASGRWGLAFLIEKMTAAPARVMGRQREWGTLAVGCEADVVLLDVEEAFEMTVERLASRSRNCPWLGRTLTGRAVLTLVGGRVAWADQRRFEGLR